MLKETKKPRAAANCDWQCPGTCSKPGSESAQPGGLTQSHPLNKKDRKLWSGWAKEDGDRCENHLRLPRLGAMTRQLMVSGKGDISVHPAGSWSSGKPNLPVVVQGHFIFLLSLLHVPLLAAFHRIRHSLLQEDLLHLTASFLHPGWGTPWPPKVLTILLTSMTT